MKNNKRAVSHKMVDSCELSNIYMVSDLTQFAFITDMACYQPFDCTRPTRKKQNKQYTR